MLCGFIAIMNLSKIFDALKNKISMKLYCTLGVEMIQNIQLEIIRLDLFI